ncbi:MAG: glycosyltransferase, partial [Ferruginibacter sp.]
FIMSSNSEGFPNALLEALASGVPSISTDCPTGPRELLTGIFESSKICTGVELGKYGILTPVNDAKSLAEAMELMMDNDQLRNDYSEKGRQRAREFDLHKLIQKFDVMLQNAIN